MKRLAFFLVLGSTLIFANTAMAEKKVVVVPLGDELYVISIPSCNSSDVTACTTAGSCIAAGGYWWSNNSCNNSPEANSEFSLPDTGQTKCYDTDGNVIACASTGQDGEYSINPMSFTDNGNGTITDNITGLMWQQQDNDTTYNWYQASGTAEATYNPSGAINVCGSLTLGGHNDWRLPTKRELVSIVNLGTYSPAIDVGAFPGTKGTNSIASYYWTSTTNAENTTYARGIKFYDGQVTNERKGDDLHYVRCVR